MADEDIVVALEADATAKSGEQIKDPVADLKAQYDELQAQKDAETAGRVAAEQRAEQERRTRVAAENEAKASRTEITETRLSTVEQGLAAAKTESDAAKAAYSAAMEAGNWAAAADAQERLAAAQARLVRLDEAKADLEVTKSSTTTQRQADVSQRAIDPPGDPVEAFIASRDSGTQAWLRKHMDDARVLATNSNPRRVAKLNAADNDAVAEGYERGSTQYFSHVEKYLGMTQPEKKDTPKPSVKREGAPVAPVQASAGGVNGGTEVRLTKTEAQSATDGTLVWNYDDPSGQKRFKKGDPIGTQEFARRKLALQQNGAYDRAYVEQ